MESTLLLCVLHVSFMSALARMKYNTNPEFPTSSQTAYYPRPNPLAKECFLNPNKGPCRGNIKMWYFDPKQKDCTTFRWGGCQGNGNRFDSRSECIQNCFIPPNYKPSRPRYCQLTFDYGFCFGAVNRWYYDRNWKVCKKNIFSGCGGNKNNFHSFQQCDSVCRLGKDPTPQPTTLNLKSGLKNLLAIDTPKMKSNN